MTNNRFPIPRITRRLFMNYNTVIFDLDGTLLNTLDDLCDSTNYALSSHGLPVRTLSEVKSFVGNGVRLLIERAVPSGTSIETIDSVYHTFKDYYKDHMKDKTGPYDGIIQLLTRLKERNVRTAIVSNKYDAAVKQLASDYFDGLVMEAIGESPLIPKKPAPDSVFAALDRLNSTKEHCLYVGDSDVDMKTAHNAGVTGVGVTWGFRDRDCLISNGAVHIIDEPMELLALLD